MAIDPIHEGLNITITEKKCPKCDTVKPASSFNKQSRSKTGLQAYCRACNLEANKDFIRRNPTASRRHVSVKDVFRIRHIERSVARSRASHAVDNAVLDGTLPKPESCEYCDMRDTSVLHAHHYRTYAEEDYLTIHWVCPPCHHRWHEDHGEVPIDLDWKLKKGDIQ